MDISQDINHMCVMNDELDVFIKGQIMMNDVEICKNWSFPLSSSSKWLDFEQKKKAPGSRLVSHQKFVFERKKILIFHVFKVFRRTFNLIFPATFHTPIERQWQTTIKSIMSSTFSIKLITSKVNELRANFSRLVFTSFKLNMRAFFIYRFLCAFFFTWKFIWDDTQHHQSVCRWNCWWWCAHRILLQLCSSIYLVWDRMNWTDFDIIQLRPRFLLIASTSHLTLHELELDGWEKTKAV